MDPLSKRIAYFKRLHLFNTFHLNAYLKTSLPLRFFSFALFFVTSAVVHIRLGNHLLMHEHIFVVQLFIWSSIVPLLLILVCGKIFKSSTQLIASYKFTHWHVSKITKKTVKSLRPFGVRVGLCKALTYGAFNVFFFCVIKSLTTVLVSLPHR